MANIPKLERDFKGKISDDDLAYAGIKKLASVTFGSSIKFHFEEPQSDIHYGSNRTNKFHNVIFWSPPVPKMPTRNLAMALSRHAHMRQLPGLGILSEHSTDGWGPGSVYDMINRSSRSIYQFSEFLFDNVIVVLDGVTDTPFLFRKITPRARLLFVTAKEPTADQARMSDAIVRYDRKAGLTDELVEDLAANIKHIVQIYTGRTVSSYLNLKSKDALPDTLDNKSALRLDQTPDALVFVLPRRLTFKSAETFDVILDALYNNAEHVLVPSYLNLAHDGLLAATQEKHIEILTQLLREGMRCQVVVAP